MYGLSSLFPGLCAGTYDIYLIDDGGCTDTITLTVVETNAPVITSIDVTGSSCGQSDGSITINATGGLAPLEYSIDGGANFQLSNFFDGHPAGVYSIVVRDDAGCETTGSANIQDIGAPVINSVITTPTSCGTFDGTITINCKWWYCPPDVFYYRWRTIPILQFLSIPSCRKLRHRSKRR